MPHEAEFIGEDDMLDPEYDGRQEAQEAVKLERDMMTERGVLEARKGSYYRMFVEGQPSRDDRELVLNDLNRFCRFGTTAFHEDERIHVLLSGRQEVAIRINDFTRLSVDELQMKYTAANRRNV